MIKKIILILAIIVLSMCCTSLISVKACDNIVTEADGFLDKGKENANNAISSEKLKDASSLLYNTLLTIGICAAVIIGAVLGIQFMVGSVEQKAKIKDSLIPYVAGCVIIFGAFGIWKLVITMMNKV